MNIFINKKIRVIALLALLMVILSASLPVMAVDEMPAVNSGDSTETNPPPANTTPITLQSPLKAESLGALIQDFVDIFSYIVVLLAVLALIYVGFQYILSSAQGNSNKIKELHSWLLYIVIGVAIVIGARAIVQVVINTLSATGTLNQKVIDSAQNAAKGN